VTSRKPSPPKALITASSTRHQYLDTIIVCHRALYTFVAKQSAIIISFIERHLISFFFSRHRICVIGRWRGFTGPEERLRHRMSDRQEPTSSAAVIPVQEPPPTPVSPFTSPAHQHQTVVMRSPSSVSTTPAVIQPRLTGYVPPSSFGVNQQQLSAYQLPATSSFAQQQQQGADQLSGSNVVQLPASLVARQQHPYSYGFIQPTSSPSFQWPIATVSSVQQHQHGAQRLPGSSVTHLPINLASCQQQQLAVSCLPVPNVDQLPISSVAQQQQSSSSLGSYSLLKRTSCPSTLYLSSSSN